MQRKKHASTRGVMIQFNNNTMCVKTRYEKNTGSYRAIQYDIIQWLEMQKKQRQIINKTINAGEMMTNSFPTSRSLSQPKLTPALVILFRSMWDDSAFTFLKQPFREPCFENRDFNLKRHRRLFNDPNHNFKGLFKAAYMYYYCAQTLTVPWSKTVS